MTKRPAHHEGIIMLKVYIAKNRVPNCVKQRPTGLRGERLPTRVGGASSPSSVTDGPGRGAWKIILLASSVCLASLGHLPATAEHRLFSRARGTSLSQTTFWT